MPREVRTFLTFQGGVGTAALDFYRDVFDDFELVTVEKHGANDSGPEGTIKVAQFRIGDHAFSCSDSAIDHAWGFTPAVSVWVECDDAAELARLFDALSEHGTVFMPLDDYGFSARFGWVGDRYGLTWQLNLA